MSSCSDAAAETLNQGIDAKTTTLPTVTINYGPYMN